MAVIQHKRIPVVLLETYNDTIALITPFCDQYLSPEYFALLQQATVLLCRKRPCPLVSDSPAVWACGIIQAVGEANFLFDKVTKPSLSKLNMYIYFAVSPEVSAAKAKQIKSWLGMYYLSPSWCLSSRSKTPWY